MLRLQQQEAKIDSLLQTLSVLIGRMGGEVSISEEEYETYRGVEIRCRTLSPDYVVIYLSGGEEE